MAGITLKNIVKTYPGGVNVVPDLNLEIEDKEFIILVGPSGCGKSTTLRMIAGLEEVTDGELYIGGKLMNNVAPKDRDIAMVFQSYALYPHMTVYKNMAFGLLQRKVPKDEIDKAVRRARKFSIWKLTSAASLRRFQAASASVLHLGAPWCAIPRCFCWMSRFQTSTQSSAQKCARRFPSSTESCKPRLFTSPTTRRRP